MPVPPVVTVVIVVSVTIAASLAFKEFVYEPHLAPRVAVWRSNFRLGRGRRSLGAHPIAVGVDAGSREMSATGRSNLELDELPARGADRWQGESSRITTLRNRFGRSVEEPGSGLDAPNGSLPHVPLVPTHVSAGSSTPSTPRSNNVTFPEPASTPTRNLSHRSSSLTLRSPSPPLAHLPQEHSPLESANAPSANSRERDDFDILSTSSGPGSPFSDFSFAAAQSPPAPNISPDVARDMGFVSVFSPGSDSGSDGSDSDGFESDLASSGVLGWASASARSFDEA